MKYSIAIDGPAASGKSSAASIVSKRLGFERLDSGMLYRAVTYLIIDKFKNYDLLSQEVKDFVSNISLTQEKGKLYYQDNDITNNLRTPEIDTNVGIVAKELYIRKKIGEIQYEILKNFHSSEGVVVDGRDIGSVILPNAFLKIFITATSEKRAERRTKQLNGNYDEVLNDIKIRDNYDLTREHGKLKCAEDAIVVNNDNLTLDQTVDEILHLFDKKKLNK